jgi:integrase
MHPHVLRHTFASHAIMRGVPLELVQEWMGHATINMIMRYAHLAEGIGHELINRLAPEQTAHETRSTLGAHDLGGNHQTPPQYP